MKLTRSEKKAKSLNITTVEEGRKYIGLHCAKFSGKPFKSGNKINVITDVGFIDANDGSKKLAFYFEEDGSYVSCQMVYIKN